MKLRRSSLAAILLIIFGASRLHAAPAIAYSSITYCLGATPQAIGGASVNIYTVDPWWYIGVTDAPPGLMGGTYQRSVIGGTQALLHLNGNGTDSVSGNPHPVNPTNASYAINPCGDGTGTPGAAQTSWGGGLFGLGDGLNFTGSFSAQCCTSALSSYGGCWPGTESYASNNSYAVITNLGSVFTNKSFSVELWVKNAAAPAQNPAGDGDAPILELCSSPGTTDKCLHLTIRNGSPYLGFFGDDLGGTGGQAGKNGSCPVLGWGGWHHLAYTFDTTQNNLQSIYVDGHLQCQGTASSVYKGSGGTAYLGIAPHVSPGNNFNGQMDDIRITNTALTGGQVASDMTGQGWYWADGSNHSLDWHPYYAGWGTNWARGNTWAQFNMNPDWNLGLNSNGGLTVGINSVNHAVEDESENLTYSPLAITVDQSDLYLPPTPTATSIGYSSITWTWSSYRCNSPYTTYSLATNAGTPGAPNSLTTYTAGPVPPLTPNTNYTLSVTATYVDNSAAGGSGASITSGASPTSTILTLAAPPTSAPNGFLATGPNSVQMTAHILPNPNNTRCQLWAKENGAYSVVIPYQSMTENQILTASNLPKSTHYVFSMNCENDAGYVAVRGPDSAGDPPTSFVSQPSTPLGFSGNAPTDAPIVCPKTSIQWSWSPVNMGSAYPPSSASTPYEVHKINSDGTGPLGVVTCNATGATTCIETGLNAATQYPRVVRAEDTDVGGYLMFAQWSDTSAVANISTSGNFTDAPTNLTATPGANLITWSWTAPTNICVPFEYDIYDAQSPFTQLPNGTVGNRLLANQDPSPTWTQFRDVANAPLGTNALYSVQVRAYDSISAQSPLSPSATAYTLANQPGSLVAAVVSTGSMLIQWDPAGNPNYTRYEVSMAPDNFGLPGTYSNLESIANNYTATNLQVNGLSAGTTYYFRVRAANGRVSDSYGGLLTGYEDLASTITWPMPPTLTGTGMSTATVNWNWNYVTGAVGYKLVTDANVTINDSPNAWQTSFSSSSFLPNTLCGAKIAAYNSNGTAGGLGPYSTPASYAFTLATTPVVTAGINGISGVSSDTVSLAWTANGNASYTFYQIVLATDSAFGVVAATVSVEGTATMVGGLFPGSTYYAQLRAINGAQQLSNFVAAGSTTTNTDPQVTRSTAPASPYAIPPGLVGLWHLDEASGTLANDASGWGNTGQLTCVDIPAICSAPASTPTFTTDALPGMGTAVSFSGLRNSLLEIPDANQYDSFTGSITVSAWVQPLTNVQPNGAGIVTKGTWGNESFSLELTNQPGGPRYLFRVVLAGPTTVTVFGTSTIRTGQWDLVTGVFDGGPANQVTLYIDGIFAASATAGGLMRMTNGAPISVGNRMDATTAYNLGFAGVIDDIRVVNAAANAAGAASLYASYSPSQLTPPGVNKGIQLFLPPNAFPTGASIYISDDPINHPVKIPYTLLAQALAQTPTGQMLLPPSLAYPTLVEIVPTLDGVNYYNGPLGSSAVLSLPYADANGDGIIDGSNPPVPVSKLQFYTLDSTVLAWDILPTTVDTVARRVSATVPHFSVFGLFGATSFGQASSAVRVYPIPWKIGAGGRFDTPAAGPCMGIGLAFGCEQSDPTVGCLPTSGSIRILTISGEKVIDIPFASTDAGTKCWDGRNTAGKAVASGVYFAQIKSSVDGSSQILKFAIEK